MIPAFDIYKIRELGELCRFTWWGLVKLVPGDDVDEFTQSLVYPLISHWELCEPMFVQCIEKFEELETDIKIPKDEAVWCTTEINEILQKCNGQTLKKLDMLRWATVFFWGFPETNAIFQISDFREVWRQHFIEQRGEDENRVLDCACLEGTCMALGHPTKLMLKILAIYGKCEEEKPLMH